MINVDGVEIRWNGHDGFRFESKDNNKKKKVVYVDPYKLVAEYNHRNDADIILISHNHFDHLSVEDINKIIRKNTKICCSEECMDSLKKNYPENDIILLKPRETKKLEDEITITGIEAYNTNKNFHPKKDKKIGFILEINNLSIYHTGDTDIIPEMEKVNSYTRQYYDT